MPNFYGTFMQKQAFKNHYVKFVADTKALAREAMFAHFGDKFMSVYDEKEFLPQIDQFNLIMLCQIIVINHGSHPDHPSLEYIHGT